MANNQSLDREFGLMAWDRQDPYTGLTWLFYALFRTPRTHISTTPEKWSLHLRRGSSIPPVSQQKNSTAEGNPTSKTSRPRISSLFIDSEKSSKSLEANLNSIIPPSPCAIQWDLPADISANILDGNDWPFAKVDSMYYDDVHLRGSAANTYSAWLAGQLDRRQ